MVERGVGEPAERTVRIGQDRHLARLSATL